MAECLIELESPKPYFIWRGSCTAFSTTVFLLNFSFCMMISHTHPGFPQPHSTFLQTCYVTTCPGRLYSKQALRVGFQTGKGGFSYIYIRHFFFYYFTSCLPFPLLPLADFSPSFCNWKKVFHYNMRML